MSNPPPPGRGFIHDRLDPYGHFPLGDYRIVVAACIKCLIRARAKAEPKFLSKGNFRRWHLENIADDKQSVEALLLEAWAAHTKLWNEFHGPNGSGGVPLGDPLASLKEAVVQFTLANPPEELLREHQQQGRIDWETRSEWERLPVIRDGLDQLPDTSGAQSKADCPVRLVDPDQYDVLVRGTRKRLAEARWNVVQALVEVFPETLTKDELVERSGHSDARGIIDRLRESDTDWADAIRMAGSTGGGYGLNPWKGPW